MFLCVAFGLTASEAKVEVMCSRTKKVPKSTTMFIAKAAGQ